MPVLVLLIYHGHSHFNACFKMAKLLRTRFRVVFAGFIYFEKYVTGQGFEFYPLRTVPFGLGFEEWVNKIEKKRFIYLKTLTDRWNARLYYMREAELSRMIKELQPAYLLIDAWQSTDFIVLYQLLKGKIRTAIIQTMLSNRLKKDLPPLNSNTLPGMHFAIKRSHINFRFQAFRRNVVQWITFLGNTNQKMIQKKISDNNIPPTYFARQPTLFNPALDHLHEIMLSVREFDFKSIHQSSFEHYAGFMIDKERSEPADLVFESVFNLVQKRIHNGSMLIYCSFGTVDFKNQKPIKYFLKKLFQSATRHTKLVFLIAGNAYSLLKEFKLPENVFAVKLAPQLRILQQASVFITHGGINSIKEAIIANVPMLVYPTSNITDSKGLAARVIYHKLGLRGKIHYDSPDDISKKITSLLQEPHFKSALKNMASANDRYSESQIFDILDTLTPPE